MMDRLITREGVVFELEDRELEETCVPRRTLEVLEEFADVQGLKRRPEWLGDGYIVRDPAPWRTPAERARPETAPTVPRRLPPGGPRRFTPEWWKQRYARLKADPARHAKEHAQKLAWQKQKYREDAAYRKHRNEDASRRMRSWYARVKSDPIRRRKLLDDICRRSKVRYQKLKTDPARREEYEAFLRKAAQRSLASYRRRRKAS